MSDLRIYVRRARRGVVDAPRKLAFLGTLLKRRLTTRSHNRVVVISFYMKNIARDVVRAQAAAITRFLPKGADLVQLKTGFGHGRSIDLFLTWTNYDIVVLLDIDCVPITSEALLQLIAAAEAGQLVGAAQRANHIDNDHHLFVGPFLMAFSRATYQSLGAPSFRETPRGDVGEELTYCAQACNHPICFLWPTSCEEPKWHVTGDIHCGRNTIYENAFLHAFEIRMPDQQKVFLATIDHVLRDEPVPWAKAVACGRAIASASPPCRGR
jgi:hypothetical protein